MSSKNRLHQQLRKTTKAERKALQKIRPDDTLVDYIKLLYEMDQEAKLAAKMREEGEIR